MIITNLLFKTHNCRKIRSPTKIWGRVSAHVILAFLSDGHLLTFSMLKVPTTAIRSSIATQLFLFSLYLGATLSVRRSRSLSLFFSPPSSRFLRQCGSSFPRAPGGTPFFFFVPFCTRFYLKKRHPPVFYNRCQRLLFSSP